MNRRMTSIVRQLHWSWIWKKFRMFLAQDLLIFLSLIIFWLIIQELSVIGQLHLHYSRYLEPEGVGNTLESWTQIQYVVKDTADQVVMRIRLFPMVLYIGIFVLVILGNQLLGMLFSYVGEDRKIRKILTPINEMALRADELNRMVFSEDKYQLIEDAIYDLQPEEAEERISFGDAELQGIETAINNLLAHMRESYRQQARFVNDASHELRTPIAVIQGYANMLSRWGTEDEKVLEESISAIRHESDHMQHLVEQLLFLARGDSGKMRLEIQPVLLNDLMQEIYEESEMIDEKHEYHYAPPGELIPVYADVGLLKQAVRILVDNGAKYTKEGDEISLEIGRNEQGDPYLQVQDCGIGMDESEVEHMFERFYRSDEARAYQGTGLGLSIAKWIVDKHKGHFDILSRKDLGTRIRIVLKEHPPAS